MTQLFHTLCFADIGQYARQWPTGVHQVEEDCWCGPDLEISSEEDHIVIRHRCDSPHPVAHNWVAVMVGELPLNAKGFLYPKEGD